MNATTNGTPRRLQHLKEPHELPSGGRDEATGADDGVLLTQGLQLIEGVPVQDQQVGHCPPGVTTPTVPARPNRAPAVGVADCRAAQCSCRTPA